MPVLRLINKINEEVYVENFDSTGRPLPRMIEREKISYLFEIKTGDTYTYKEFSTPNRVTSA